MHVHFDKETKTLNLDPISQYQAEIVNNSNFIESVKGALEGTPAKLMVWNGRLVSRIFMEEYGRRKITGECVHSIKIGVVDNCWRVL